MLEYTCAQCKGDFVSDTPDDEVLSEFLLGPFYIPDQPVDIICDDCYKLLQHSSVVGI